MCAVSLPFFVRPTPSDVHLIALLMAEVLRPEKFSWIGELTAVAIVNVFVAIRNSRFADVAGFVPNNVLRLFVFATI